MNVCPRENPTVRRRLTFVVLAILTCFACAERAAAQMIQTVAGNGTAGYSGDGGPAAAAVVNNPFGVAVDSLGNLYIADTNNHRIRVVNTGTSPITVANVTIQPGKIATVAGNGSFGFSGDGGAATSAVLYNPTGVAVDPSGNIFIADLYNLRVRKVTSGGIISTIAGTGTTTAGGDDGPATAATLYPYALAVDANGSLYIADSVNQRVRVINTSASAVTVAGITVQPGFITTVAGSGVQGSFGNGVAATSAQLNYPYGLSVDTNGNLYICDTYNRSVRVVNTGAVPITVATVNIQPGFIATVAGTGSYGHKGDGGPATSAQLADPDGVAADAAGNIYISDLESERIRFVANSTGLTATIAGTGGLFGYNGDGIPASIAALSYPRSIAVDGSGNIYFADQPNERIRVIAVNTGSFTSRASTAFTVGSQAKFAVTTNDQPTPVLTVTGALPSGVTFVDKGNGSGTLAGTPAAGTAGIYNITFTASNGVFPNAVQNFTLTVYAPGTAPITGSATFVAIDTVTQGSWQTVYGADGSSLANFGSPTIPPYVSSLAVQNQDNYTWAINTADVRALQIPNSSGRIASTWYNTVSFTIDLNAGPDPHQVAIYALDWDGQGRSEMIQVLDADTGAPLDTQTISGFSGGAYLSWNISGHVQIVATAIGGPNAIVSAVFFGGAGSGGGGGGTTAFVGSYTSQAEIRNNFTGWLGMKLTVGASSLSVASIGRVCIAGNVGTHTVKFVNATTGADISGGSVALNMSGCAIGQFLYGVLPSAITLQSGGAYYLVTQEVLNGDHWYDDRPILFTNVAAVNNSIYSSDGVNWIPAGAVSTSYGPPNFQYSVIPAVPISVTVQTNPSGPSFTVDGTTYTTPQAFSWTAGSLHTVATTNPQSGPVAGSQFAWSGWSDGGSLSHTVSPSSAATFTANFSTQYQLSTSFSPPGGGSIATSPFSPTGYYDSGTSVQLTATPNPVCTLLNWGGDLAGTVNPQPLTMSTPHSVSATFQCSGPPATSFLTGFALSSPPLRNNFSGWAGMKVTVGANPLSARSLGRVCVAGNSGTHTVKLVNGSSGTDVPGGSVPLNMAGCTAGQFVYGSLGGGVTLQSGTIYYLASQEFNGGDQWYDHGTVSSTSDASVLSSIYSLDGSNWTLSSGTNTSFVPPNILYSVIAPVPISVTVQASLSGPSFTVDGTTYTTPQVFSWTAGSSHTIATSNPQSAGAGIQYVWGNWSDGGSISHTVVPASAATFTANFTTQFLLSTSVSPAGGGGITVTPASASGFFNSGTPVQLTATPSPVCTFVNWSGDLSGNTNPQPLTMSSAHTVTANFQCNGPASTNFVTGFALNNPTLRNNFSGWVGMKLTVAGSSLNVASLGRVCTAGNAGTHTVKFVSAGTGADVAGGSLALNMAGCTAGQFRYGALSQAITLQANTSYYLVSQEVSGGDQWYDYGTLSHTIAAAVNNSIYSQTGTNWNSVSVANTSYVPLDFQYSLAPADPTFVISYNLNNRPLRNDFSGWVGMKFTTGANGMIANSLGRIFVTGNSGTHAVKLVRASDGNDVPGASISLPMAGGSAGQFSYAALASPVTLQASTAYYLVSQEQAGGDQWYDYGTLSTTSVAVVNSAVYWDGAKWVSIGAANTSYVPPNLK